MIYPILKSGFTEWEIIINPDLQFARAETWKHGIKRYWGFDPTTKTHKLIYVQYPKNKFSRDDMNRILPKYTGCKLCIIGKKFIKGKNNTTINMNYSIVDLFGKIPKIGSSITRNRFMSEPIIMNILSTISRYPIAMVFKPFGKALASILVGIAGEVGVAYLIKNNIIQGEWATFFANYISSIGEMPAKGGVLSLGYKDDLRRLKSAIKSGNFYGIADSLLNDAGAIKRAIKGYGTNFKKTFANIRRGGRRLRTTETTLPTKLRKRPFGVKFAEDFKYKDTSHRFREIGTFGSGFRKERRFRESGDAVYNALYD
nr:MAG: hypothetical protein [uncultured archaeon]